MTKTLISIITCLIAGTAIAEPADDVRCREINFSQSVENQDIDAFRSFIDVDARFIGSGVLRGVDQVAQAWSVFFTTDGPRIKWRPQIVEVLENGTLALSRGPFKSVAIDAHGNVQENWGTFNSVWRLNEDGEWRVVFDAGSPAASEPSEETKALLNDEVGC